MASKLDCIAWLAIDGALDGAGDANLEYRVGLCGGVPVSGVPVRGEVCSIASVLVVMAPGL